MSISGVYPVERLFSAYSARKRIENSNESTFSSTAKTDTVHISKEAKAYFQKSQTEKESGAKEIVSVSDEVLPVEAYALPTWFSDWIPDIAKIDGSSLKSVEQSTRRYQSLGAKKQNDIGEYTMTLFKYLREELDDRDIKGGAEYYKAIHLDKRLSEEIHQAVKNRIAEDSRAMDLMQSLEEELT